MERIYNGIMLTETWPPENISTDKEVKIPVPYLESPPEVIDITVGRQLFVDDFLIEKTDLEREYHSAEKIPDPVLTPDREWEKRTLPGAAPKSGGVWYDEKDCRFKMWYEASWLGEMAYAESSDGFIWEKPELDIVKGTNLILPGIQTDSTTVFIDEDTCRSSERYKMFIRRPGAEMPGYSLTSGDGIHWSEITETGLCYDRSTMFYNPFRKKWIYSIRSNEAGRARNYYECDDFIRDADWKDKNVFWMRVDGDDRPAPDIGFMPQLYNFDAVGYESIMLGMFEIHLGPENDICEKHGYPKRTELIAAYSRDGFHFSRPSRKAFIPASVSADAWDRGYVQSAGGVCVVNGEELLFYYIGFKGDESNLNPDWMHNGMYSNSSTGVAKLRRDGFASMKTDETGELYTRKLIFDGKAGLFVNINAESLVCGIEDAEGSPIPGFGVEDSIPVSGDLFREKLLWKNGGDISSLNGKAIRLRFRITNGRMYSFWMGDAAGESGGARAAGIREINYEMHR